MSDRPAPLFLVASGSSAESPPFGSYAAVAENGRRHLATELSHRLGAIGAALVPLAPVSPAKDGHFHWGRWFGAAARAALEAAQERGVEVDAIGYAGAGALALTEDRLLDDLCAPLAGEVIANNRFSADAFVVSGDLATALATLDACATDNAAPRQLGISGFTVRDLAGAPWSRFDVDTPLDLALLRLASRLPDARRLGEGVRRFLDMATLPGGGRLEVPAIAELEAVLRDRNAELVVAGRVPSTTLGYLEDATACRVRAFVEERGMRSSNGADATPPRSLLWRIAERLGPEGLIAELVGLGDAVVLDTRVLMASHAGSAAEEAWPAAEERFASDLLDADRVRTPWLASLTAAAHDAPVPVLLGGHTLVSDGLRVIVEAAWAGC